ncbi:MAG TPA: TCR/Tet family MFS transporter [Trichocoleus sp.]|jgi:DHA1 family tetracycline resistance protein-like MFS transporter
MKSRRAPGLIFVLLTLFIDVMGVGLSNPVLPTLIGQYVDNISTTSVYFGAVMTLYALMLFLFSPIQGGLSDRFGRKPLLLLSLLGTGLSYIALTLAPSLPWIFAAQMMNGLTGASVAVTGAYIADISGPEERSKNFGLLGATIGIGWVLGPALGGLLGSIGLRVPFLIAAILSFLNLLYGLLFVPESHRPEHRQSFSWVRANPIGSLLFLRKNAAVLGLAMVIFCNDLALQCLISTWVLFTSYKFQWTTIEVGLSLALLGLVTAIVQGGVMRHIISRFGERRTIVIGLVLCLIGYLLYAVVDQGWLMYGVILLNGFDFVVKPTAQGILSMQVNAREQGALQGAIASQTAFTSIIGPFVATGLFGYFVSAQAPFHLPEVPFLLGAGLFAIALWLAIMTFSNKALWEKQSIS